MMILVAFCSHGDAIFMSKYRLSLFSINLILHTEEDYNTWLYTNGKTNVINYYCPFMTMLPIFGGIHIKHKGMDTVLV